MAVIPGLRAERERHTNETVYVYVGSHHDNDIITGKTNGLHTVHLGGGHGGHLQADGPAQKGRFRLAVTPSSAYCHFSWRARGGLIPCS